MKENRIVKNQKRARTFGINIEILKKIDFLDMMVLFYGINECEVNRDFLKHLTPFEIICFFYSFKLIKKEIKKQGLQINDIKTIKEITKKMIEITKKSFDEKNKKGFIEIDLNEIDKNIIEKQIEPLEKRIDKIDEGEIKIYINCLTRNEKGFFDPNTEYGTNKHLYMRKIIQKLEEKE